MANVETRRDENTLLRKLVQHTNTSSMSGDSLGDSTTSLLLSRSGLSWAKILGEEPLFSCMGLSFEERFGNL